MEDSFAISTAAFEYIKERYSDCYLGIGASFVQLKVALPDDKRNDALHYELFDGKMQLHFEWGVLGGDWWNLRAFLISATRSQNDIIWDTWYKNKSKTRAILNAEINDVASLEQAIQKIRSTFDPLIQMHFKIGDYAQEEQSQLPINQNWPTMLMPSSDSQLEISVSSQPPVTLYDMSLLEIFNLDLSIPPYQRIYCWQKKNVIRLLTDVFEATSEYRLGCIILQRVKDKDKDSYCYEIIDGQQRLTTLAMMLNGMGVSGIKLLERSYKSKESENYVAYNKYLINTYLSSRQASNEKQILEKMGQLTFSVLIVNDESINLAYTFFSNQNAKGKRLSDYDLLKAHHLRFIDEEDIQKEKAERWDGMIQEEGKDDEKAYVRTLDRYLFRLRKWLCRDEWAEQEPLRIKNEYEASEYLSDLEIGSEFSAADSPYFEAIRGGEYFFDYTEYYLKCYKVFVKTPAYMAIHDMIEGETHWYYRDIIEALLFAYFLKFGENTLPEAAILIAREVSSTRLTGKRANFDKVLTDVGEMRIAPLIESSGKPSILFSQLMSDISVKRIDVGSSKIQQRYKDKLKMALDQLSCIATLNSVKHFARI